jgi:hypothetical protein
MVSSIQHKPNGPFKPHASLSTRSFFPLSFYFLFSSLLIQANPTSTFKLFKLCKMRWCMNFLFCKYSLDFFSVFWGLSLGWRCHRKRPMLGWQLCKLNPFPILSFSFMPNSSSLFFHFKDTNKRKSWKPQNQLAHHFTWHMFIIP